MVSKRKTGETKYERFREIYPIINRSETNYIITKCHYEEILIHLDSASVCAISSLIFTKKVLKTTNFVASLEFRRHNTDDTIQKSQWQQLKKTYTITPKLSLLKMSLAML